MCVCLLYVKFFFKNNFSFLDIFSKNIQKSNFMKIRPVKNQDFFPCGTDRRTDEHTDSHDETNSRFTQFCERASKPRN